LRKEERLNDYTEVPLPHFETQRFFFGIRDRAKGIELRIHKIIFA
jgi:hypothetical protein